jgi:hypothetical protein
MYADRIGWSRPATARPQVGARSDRGRMTACHECFPALQHERFVGAVMAR